MEDQSDEYKKKMLKIGEIIFNEMKKRVAKKEQLAKWKQTEQKNEDKDVKKNKVKSWANKSSKVLKKKSKVKPSKITKSQLSSTITTTTTTTTSTPPKIVKTRKKSKAAIAKTSPIVKTSVRKVIKKSDKKKKPTVSSTAPKTLVKPLNKLITLTKNFVPPSRDPNFVKKNNNKVFSKKMCLPDGRIVRISDDFKGNVTCKIIDTSKLIKFDDLFKDQ